jgi:hypothetical protein
VPRRTQRGAAVVDVVLVMVVLVPVVLGILQVQLVSVLLLQRQPPLAWRIPVPVQFEQRARTVGVLGQKPQRFPGGPSQFLLDEAQVLLRTPGNGHVLACAHAEAIRPPELRPIAGVANAKLNDVRQNNSAQQTRVAIHVSRP